MKTFLFVLCGLAIVLGLFFLILAATDSVVPLHGVLVALICAAYIGWYQWKGKLIGK
jgi:hypothetical protein